MTAAATTFVALIGPGQVGQAFLRQLATHSASARAATYPVALAAVANSRRMLLGAGPAKPLPFAGWEAALATASAAEAAGHFSSNADLGTFASFLAEKFPRGRVVIVDCSASDAIAARYPEWLQLRHSIVTPNKRAFSGDPALYKRILDAAADAGKTEPALRGPFVYHESTVGAGLPVLSTLNDLVRTGDKLQRVEGILSGTLSYLFNSFSAATASASGEAAPKFSQIVKVAKDLGYTEPDPRDDLNGVDFARKVVILARLAGLHDVSLDTLHIENIVPEQLRGLASADEFMARLPEYDDHFDTLNKQALAEQSVLRYVGVIEFDPATGKANAKVQLGKYKADHALALLKGSDNIVAFTTERFTSPLVVQGAGAGADVTAFGMFSDLLKVCERL